MNKINLNVAKEFSRTPGPRYIKEGNYSGELFRIECLKPFYKNALTSDSKLEVNLDGTAGYGTSFLEEAFGGLAREMGIDSILSRLEFVSNEETYLIEDIIEYIKDANKQ